MASANVYLNFDGQSEEALRFYAEVFDVPDDKIRLDRFSKIPPLDGMPPLSEDDKQRVLHGSLPLLGNDLLMVSDTMPGMQRNVGTHVSICLHPDTREDADRLFAALSVGGLVNMPLADAFWGAYYGTLTDKFGVQWMINCETH